MGTFDMTKKEIISAIKKSTAVYVAVHGMTEHDMYYIRVRKVDILDTISNINNDIMYHAWIDEFNDLQIG